MNRFMLLIISLLVSLYSVSTGLFFILLPSDNWILWPQKWLMGTPFHDLRMPGILLIVIVGATNCWGVWNLLKEHPRQFDRAMLGGYGLMIWVIIELLLNRELYLIHLTAIVLGAAQVLLAFQEKDKWAV